MKTLNISVNKRRKHSTQKEKREKSKMKKKTITTIMSMITILFIFSSMSYAATSDEWVAAHNYYRGRHINTPKVTWSDELAKGAQDRVNAVKGKKWEHTGGVSENGAMGYFPNVQAVVDDWHSEEEYYDYNTGTKKTTAPANETIGHFLPVVGSNVTKIGCASDPSAKTFKDGVWWTGIYVCQYDAFGKNVMPLKKMGHNIVWRHSSGNTFVWYMDGATFQPGQSWAYRMGFY